MTAPSPAIAAMSDLIHWLESLRPLTEYGRVGSRDVDQAAMQKALDGAIASARALLAAPAAAEDARRLDWLETNKFAWGWENIHGDHGWSLKGECPLAEPYSGIRAAIDAAMSPPLQQEKP